MTYFDEPTAETIRKIVVRSREKYLFEKYGDLLIVSAIFLSLGFVIGLLWKGW